MAEWARVWIHRHHAVFLSFVIGAAFGVSIVALAYFSNRNPAAANMLRYGERVTGHADLGEDLVWFLGGVVFGAGIICVAWWRDARRGGGG